MVAKQLATLTNPAIDRIKRAAVANCIVR